MFWLRPIDLYLGQIHLRIETNIFMWQEAAGAANKRKMVRRSNTKLWQAGCTVNVTVKNTLLLLNIFKTCFPGVGAVWRFCIVQSPRKHDYIDLSYLAKQRNICYPERKPCSMLLSLAFNHPATSLLSDHWNFTLNAKKNYIVKGELQYGLHMEGRGNINIY